MMEEAPTDELNQWASFSSFDFTTVTPVITQSAGQWPPFVKEELIDGEEESRNGQLEEIAQSRQNSFDESILDGSGDAGDDNAFYESQRLMEMEQEQEMLNASLISLTTHFAQVQFRLTQVGAASDIETKEKLMKELELFAFEGCPDVRGVVPKSKRNSLPSEAEHEEKHRKQLVETKELIHRLQKQLTEVEQFAYDNGQAEPPSMAILERQNLILDTLRERVKLSVDGYERLPPEELRVKIDEAIEAIIAPYRRKEVAQERTLSNMQTFIDDMERYISQMHQPGAGKAKAAAIAEKSPAKSASLVAKSGGGTKEAVDPRSATNTGYVTRFVHRTYTVFQFFAFMNWACLRERRFQRNEMKTTIKGNHWGDVRAVLELAISRVAEAARAQSGSDMRPAQRRKHQSYQDDVALTEDHLTKLVRKDLAGALAGLMRHGLIHLSSETGLVPRIMCTSRRPEVKECHPWHFLLHYYNYKNGNQFNKSATKKLSDSFQLTSVGHTTITPQQTLLSTIGEIIEAHAKFDRSPMTHLKALVCAGLNGKCLSVWLRLIYCTKPVTDEYYMPWSYATKTHFEDACRSLDILNAFSFSLPVDLAVKALSNLNDAF